MTPDDAWLDKEQGTVKFCPRCLYYPYHGATERGLCCGLPFVTETHSLRWFILTRNTCASRVVAKACGEQFWPHQEDVPPSWFRPYPNSQWAFPTQEALDRYQHARQLIAQNQWSRDWAVARYEHRELAEESR